MKKLMATLLTVAMLACLIPAFAAFSVSAAEGTGSADAIPGFATVDGEIDDAWADAPVYTMDNVVTIDSTGAEDTRKDSSTIKFRMMYNGEKIYMLFEIEDDVFVSAASGTNWKNDSLFIYISEDGADRSQTSEKSTTLCAFLEDYSEAKAGKTGLIVRDGKGANNNPKEHAVKINGNKAVMEISFQLNTVTPTEGGSFVMDLQYNDQDVDPNSSGSNTRTIVWAWSCQDGMGPNQKSNLWGTVNFVAAPECEHTNTEIVNAKDATATEDGYTGDKVCKDCGETLETGTTIPATGTPDPVTPPPTGDVMSVVSVLVLIAIAGTVAVVRRKVGE